MRPGSFHIPSTEHSMQCVHSQLSIVDLAGSERASKTGATAEQLKVSRRLHRYFFDQT